MKALPRHPAHPASSVQWISRAARTHPLDVGHVDLVLCVTGRVNHDTVPPHSGEPRCASTNPPAPPPTPPTGTPPKSSPASLSRAGAYSATASSVSRTPASCYRTDAASPRTVAQPVTLSSPDDHPQLPFGFVDPRLAARVGPQPGSRPTGRPTRPAAHCSNACGSGQEQTRFRSPYAPSIRRTGGQYFPV